MSWLIKPIKHAVSGTRYRHVEGDYDLDLAYITNRIIAMGFPGDGIEGMYRNNGEEVARFLKEKHNGHYMIWNLSEKPYQHEKFDNQVLEFGFPDHHNPPLDLLFAICKSIDSWLKADAQNVAIVHCLAGKGRTGTVIAAYLIYVGLISDPIEALAYFAKKRSYERETPKAMKFKSEEAHTSYILSLGGVNSPSQIRYVQYFHHILKNNMIVPENNKLHLRKFFVHEASPTMKRQMADGQIVINIYEMVSTGPNTVVKRLLFTTNTFDQTGIDDIICYTCNIEVSGDILITCHNKNALRDEKIFRFAFHTGFLDDCLLRLRKCDMDEACHNKTAYIQENFMVDLMFDERKTEPIVTVNQEDSEEKVSHDHLYAKTDPNTRNHILLELEKDPIVQQVIKRKLVTPQPIVSGVTKQEVVQPPQEEPIIPAQQSVENVPKSIEPVTAPVTSIPPVATAFLAQEEKRESSPRTPTKKPDILVLVVPSNDEQRPIAVKFRIKKSK